MNLETYVAIYNIGKQYFANAFLIILLAIIGTTYILKHKKKIIGFAVRTGKYLHYVAIKKEYQGRGFGRKLMKIMMPAINRLRVAEDNVKARNLYEKLGFVVMSESNWVHGKRLLMKKIRGAM